MCLQKMATMSKRSRLPPLTKVTAAERARQFDKDFYSEGSILFCKFCTHSVGFTRVDTVKDHIKSRRHRVNKERLTGSEEHAKLKQLTLTTVSQSKQLRDDFILDFVKMCTVADIPLEKCDRMKGFVVKHCKQGGSLPQTSTLRQLHVPRLFDQHFKCLQSLVEDVPVSIIADETTDIRDHSILNVIVGVQGSYYLIDVITLDSCNHSTLSRGVIQAATSVGIKFTDVIAFVSDSIMFIQDA